MADYAVGEQYKGSDGRTYTLTDPGGEAPLKWVPDASGFSMSGMGKAFGSGLLHEGIGGLFGAAGDVRDLANKGAAYLVNKAKGTEGTDDETKPEDISKAASGLGGPIGLVQKAPTSEQVKDTVTRKIAGEYEPQNAWERGAGLAGSLVPGSFLAPEAPAANLAAALGRGARSLFRYSAAPAAASQGVREWANALGIDNPYIVEPAAMATLLATPGAATKMLTPNPASAVQRAAGQTLNEAGATFTPKQLSQGKLQSEANALDSFGGPSGGTKGVNAQNTQNYNRGVLRTAFEDTLPQGPVREEAINATSITPELRTRIGGSIDNEFNRLARLPNNSLPWDTATQNGLKGIINNYEREATVGANTTPHQVRQEIENLFTTRQSAGGGLPASPVDWINGRQYLNLRSRLSSMANAENDTSVARSIRQMRDLVDDRMAHHLNTYYPHEEGAFQRAREAYQNNMIVDRAMNKAGGNAAHYNITPDDLAQASRGVLGHDVFGSEQHPMARLARAGQQVLEPLPAGGPTGLAHNWQLAATLAGGTLGTEKLLEAATHSSSGLGYMLGALAAAAPYATRPVVGHMMNSPWGRNYLSNQAIPPEFRPALTRNPANAALLTEALSRRREPNKE